MDFTETRDSEWQWHQLGPVVKVDRRIRWHYTTTILRLRIGARLTISLALSAGMLMASAGTPYRLVPANFYPWLGHMQVCTSL